MKKKQALEGFTFNGEEAIFGAGKLSIRNIVLVT